MRESSVAVVYGTRPEIIKLSPLVRLLGPAARLISTGQHFDTELSNEIASDTQMPSSAAVVEVGGKSRASQIGAGVIGLEAYLADADAAIVQGDTNSSLAGALTANAMEIPLFHVEAGLRSFDRRMPEEHNRVVVDHLADVLWAPTKGNVKNLLAEGIRADRIEQTGNSIVQSVNSMVPDHKEREARRSRLGCPGDTYILATIHRPENVDDPERLRSLIEVLTAATSPVVLPLHPRTKAVAEKHELTGLLDDLLVLPSLGYRDFLSFLKDCSLVVSDSGGIQEEVTVVKVPLIVVRRSTERPEVMGTFASLLDEPMEIADEIERVMNQRHDVRASLSDLPSPFGDGFASQRMFSSILGLLSQN